MSDQEFKSFNDPSLRTAVRRVWGDERAPRELRQQIAALCTSSGKRGSRANSEPFSMRIRSTLYGLAAAAVFILAVGIAFADWSGGGRRPLRAPRVVALPGNMATNLFARHDADEKAKKHQFAGINQTDFNTMSKELGSQLGFPVLATSLPGNGWRFHGASICTVGKIVTAHLIFDRQGKQYISLFSMPVGEVSGSGPGCDYTEVAQNHVMAGFATSVGFYCVVGSSSDDSMTVEEVRTIRDELKPIMVNVAPAPDSQLAVILPR